MSLSIFDLEFGDLLRILQCFLTSSSMPFACGQFYLEP